ncbi:hypothetical protein F751_1006 [Auxenochlorella protothecoides]|uniref:Uncharacterized protein n=1 Tax=Auxenochlorella protothecoides TaxID=3075 RepID=A0A087SC56_AUXPR|nr:hypothetical protein F751_1006 [Auxenochlorella protothecoides]KFM23310.1 hypothetical protein F751_1006 [Auxenochlorella protothecoides]
MLCLVQRTAVGDRVVGASADGRSQHNQRLRTLRQAPFLHPGAPPARRIANSAWPAWRP